MVKKVKKKAAPVIVHGAVYQSTYPNGPRPRPPLTWMYFPLLGLHCVQSSRLLTDDEFDDVISFCKETFGPEDKPLEEREEDQEDGLWSFFSASYCSKIWFKEERDYLVFLLKYSG